MTPDVLAAFSNVRQNGAGWTARCPAHEDARASLSIGHGDTQPWVLKCFAGCETDAIVRAAGLTMADLLTPRTNGQDTRRIVATYDYKDQGGALVYQVVRYTPKDFRQRRPDGKNWIWNINGVRRVLYRLPDLQGRTTVYIVEGEKDAEALRALGLAATCNAGGAGKWRPEYVTQLTAAAIDNVVVIPDHDDAGRKHAEDIARSCHAAGLAVKVVTLPDLPPKGDVSDWLAAGRTKADLVALVKATTVYAPVVTDAAATETPAAAITRPRSVHVTRASDITPRLVCWLWDGRLALGTLVLLGGREGIGKSIVAATLAADITRGRLPGVYDGTPRAVIISATEDSWSHTIVPRLMAAGADLSLVYRVDVDAADGSDAALSLPLDLPAVEAVITERHAAALFMDPIMSRLDAQLDSHKDGEVRQALEPLVAVLERTNCVGLGLIHVNKSTSSDPLTQLMASRAFAAVARAVLFVMVDPDHETTRLLGQPKNNLGRSDLPTLAFTIDGCKVAETAEGPIWTGKLTWTGESDRSIREALQQVAETGGGNRTAVQEAADWLTDYLTDKGGSADSADVKREGVKAGHSAPTLARARAKAQIGTVSVGFPRRSHWVLPSRQSSHVQSSQVPGESDHIEMIETTTANRTIPVDTTAPQSSQSSQSSQSNQTPRASDPTGGIDDGRF